MPGQSLPLRLAVALRLICGDDPRDILTAFEQLAEQLLRGLLIASTLHQDIENIVVLIQGSPQVMVFAIPPG